MFRFISQLTPLIPLAFRPHFQVGYSDVLLWSGFWTARQGPTWSDALEPAVDVLFLEVAGRWAKDSVYVDQDDEDDEDDDDEDDDDDGDDDDDVDDDDGDYGDYDDDTWWLLRRWFWCRDGESPTQTICHSKKASLLPSKDNLFYFPFHKMLPVFIDFEHFSTVLFSFSCFCPSFHYIPFMFNFSSSCLPLASSMFLHFFYLQFHLFSIILIHVHTCFLHFPKLSTIFPEFFHVFPSSPASRAPPGRGRCGVARTSRSWRSSATSAGAVAQSWRCWAPSRPRAQVGLCFRWVKSAHLAMDQYLWKYHTIPFLMGWTSILTQLFWCELQGYQGFDTLPFRHLGNRSRLPGEDQERSDRPRQGKGSWRLDHRDSGWVTGSGTLPSGKLT